jgi:hypothetical protein
MSEPAYNPDRRDAGPTELAAFHAALERLTPAPDGINIARLLFRAGQLSAPRRSWAWPCATAASMMLAIALGSVLLLRPAPQPAERIVTVYVPSPIAPPPQPEPATPSLANGRRQPAGGADQPAGQPHQPADAGRHLTSGGIPSGDGDYLQLRRQVLAHGLDALPPPQPWPAAAPADDTDTLLDLPRGSREPWLLRLKRSLQFGGPS